MELYETLKNTKSIDDSDFGQMIDLFFKHNRYSNIYEIAYQDPQNLSGIPLILKTFLLDPVAYEQFLQSILEPSVKHYGTKFKFGDFKEHIICLVCLATFHLGKLYTMLGHAPKDAAKYYHLPLGNWLSDIIQQLPDSASIETFSSYEELLQPIEYLLLMSFISKELKMEDRPICKYLSAAKSKKYQLKIMNVVPSIGINLYQAFGFKVRGYYDIYDKHLRDTYVLDSPTETTMKTIFGGLISWNYFLDKDDVTKSVFCNDLYSFNDIFKYMDTDVPEALKSMCNATSIGFFMLLAYHVGLSTVYKVLPSGSIEQDRIYWLTTILNMRKMIEYSDDLELTMKFILVMLAKLMPYKDLYKDDHYHLLKPFLLYSILQNSDPNNTKFIRKLLKAILTHNYRAFGDYAKYFDYWKGQEEVEISISVVLRLLSRLRLARSLSDPVYDKSAFIDAKQSILKDVRIVRTVKVSSYSYSFDDTPDDHMDANYFRDIIIGLLKFIKKQGMYDHQYLKELYLYKNSLMEKLNINLDDYKLLLLPSSPVSLSSKSKRSVDNVTTGTVGTTGTLTKGNKYDTNENILKKQVPVVYKKPDFKIITVSTSGTKRDKRIKIGNAIYTLDEVNFLDKDTIQLDHHKYDLKDVQFVNQKLHNRLLKHYTRTVEGMDAHEYGGPDRVIKIRKYLQSKHPKKQPVIRVETEHDQELETLLALWQRRVDKTSNSLNADFIVKYFIMVNDVREYDVGIDAGGLTKDYLTKCAKQLKSKFFKVAYEGSNRYILNSDGLQNVKFIAAFISTLILKEIYLDFSISIVYLAFLMFRPAEISDEELFLYFLLDIDAETRYNNYLKYCEQNYDDASSDEQYLAMACNPTVQVQDSLTYMYDLNHEGFKQFGRSFLFKKKMFYRKFQNINSKIRIYDMDKLLSISKITKRELKQRVFDKVELSGSEHDASVYNYFRDIMINDDKKQYSLMYSEYEKHHMSYFKDDANKMKIFNELKNSQTFKRMVLSFWTGTHGILSASYRVAILPCIGKLPEGHTCYNEISLPTGDKIKSKQELFTSFMDIFIGSMHKQFGLA